MRERISRSTVSEVLAAVESAVGDPLARSAVYRTLADHHPHLLGRKQVFNTCSTGVHQNSTNSQQNKT